MIEHRPKPQQEPSWRKPVGMLTICGLIAVWAAIVASASGLIGRLPVAVQVIVYILLGIVWILPLKPLLSWMETGSWKWGSAEARAHRDKSDSGT